MFDYIKGTYISLSHSVKSITGYEPQEFISGGVKTMQRIWNRDDFFIFNEMIFPANMDFLSKQPISDHKHFIFSFNHRIQSKSGEWLQLYQKNSYITFPTSGLPHYCFGLCIEITGLKKDNTIIHCIDNDGFDGTDTTKHMICHSYSSDTNQALLSKQEKRILSCLSEGLNSRQIAEQMHLSESTIINHRKNMQKKTNTKNIAELISFAFKYNLF
jgi:DNA-binding CsgD family transcriptional regulator